MSKKYILKKIIYKKKGITNTRTNIEEQQAFFLQAVT